MSNNKKQTQNSHTPAAFSSDLGGDAFFSEKYNSSDSTQQKNNSEKVVDPRSPPFVKPAFPTANSHSYGDTQRTEGSLDFAASLRRNDSQFKTPRTLPRPNRKESQALDSQHSAGLHSASLDFAASLSSASSSSVKSSIDFAKPSASMRSTPSFRIESQLDFEEDLGGGGGASETVQEVEEEEQKAETQQQRSTSPELFGGNGDDRSQSPPPITEKKPFSSPARIKKIVSDEQDEIEFALVSGKHMTQIPIEVSDSSQQEEQAAENKEKTDEEEEEDEEALNLKTEKKRKRSASTTAPKKRQRRSKYAGIEDDDAPVDIEFDKEDGVSQPPVEYTPPKNQLMLTPSPEDEVIKSGKYSLRRTPQRQAVRRRIKERQVRKKTEEIEEASENSEKHEPPESIEDYLDEESDKENAAEDKPAVEEEEEPKTPRRDEEEEQEEVENRKSRRKKNLDTLAKQISKEQSPKKKKPSHGSPQRNALRIEEQHSENSTDEELHHREEIARRTRRTKQRTRTRKTGKARFEWGGNDKLSDEDISQDDSMRDFIVDDEYEPTQYSETAWETEKKKRTRKQKKIVEEIEEVEDDDDGHTYPLDLHFDKEDGDSQDKVEEASKRSSKKTRKGKQKAKLVEQEEEEEEDMPVEDGEEPVVEEEQPRGKDDEEEEEEEEDDKNDKGVDAVERLEKRAKEASRRGEELSLSEILPYIKTHRKESDAFHFYIQWIASCLVDPDYEQFIREDYDKQDTDFKPSIYQIESQIHNYINTVLSSNAWNAEFREKLEDLPFQVVRPVQRNHLPCEGCNRDNHSASGKLEVFGKKYNSKELFQERAYRCHVEEEGEEIRRKIFLGSVCYRRAILYHAYYHYKRNLIECVKKKLDSIKIDAPPHKMATRKVKALMGKSEWIENLYQGFKWLGERALQFVKEGRGEDHSHLGRIHKIVFDFEDEEDMYGDAYRRRPPSAHSSPARPIRSSAAPNSSSKPKISIRDVWNTKASKSATSTSSTNPVAAHSPPRNTSAPTSPAKPKKTPSKRSRDDIEEVFDSEDDAPPSSTKKTPKTTTKRRRTNTNSRIPPLQLLAATTGEESPKPPSAPNADPEDVEDDFDDYRSPSFKKDILERRKQQLLKQHEQENKQSSGSQSNEGQNPNHLLALAEEVDDSILSVDLLAVCQKINE